MRISYTRQHEMKEQIEKDLYTQPRRLLMDKQEVLVKANYEIWVNQYKDALKILPKTMVNTSERIKLKIPAVSFEKFNLPQSEKENFDLYSCDEHTWSAHVSPEVPMLMESTGYYAQNAALPMQDALKDEIITLRIEEHNFEKEKRDLRKYLEQTFEACTTTTKLRKAWPSTLQKYIPPEPERAPKRAKPKSTIDPETLIAPTQAVKERMTENLLQS